MILIGLATLRISRRGGSGCQISAIAQWNMERPFCDVHHIGLTDVILCYPVGRRKGYEGMGMRKLIASVTVVAAMALAASS